MRMLGRWITAAAAGVLLTGAVVAPAAGSAAGSAGSGHDRRPSAAVSLGDSYISGEGGRWKGNSADRANGFQGTDRGAQVYGDTEANGCHRSDVAPIVSARLHVDTAINLACSGARTQNVLRASAGGVAFKGEAPQNDQLAAVARSHRVKLVVLSIGGNDLGFGSIANACLSAYLYGTPPCNALDAQIRASLPAVTAAVGATVADVRATMSAAGYQAEDYRFVLQSYPSATPDPDNFRYAGTAPDARATVGGCPYLDADVAWTHDTLVPALSGALKTAANQNQVQFLDLTQAFRGHELCAASAKQSTGKPVAATSEWIRFVDLTGQGQANESLHPNYFGQKALGRCLALATLTRKDVGCRAVPGLSTWAVHLTKVS